MRHGKAAPYAETDFARPLLPEGREKVAVAAQKMLAQGVKPDLFLASPLCRAQQTAEIVSQALQVPFQTEECLDGRLSAKGLLAFAQEQLQQKDTLLLVGHNPNMSILAGLLCQEYISFQAGEYMCFDMTDFANPRLMAGE